jgi:hypothetical protein
MSCVSPVLLMIAGAVVWSVIIAFVLMIYDLTKDYIDRKIEQKVEQRPDNE